MKLSVVDRLRRARLSAGFFMRKNHRLQEPKVLELKWTQKL